MLLYHIVLHVIRIFALSLKCIALFVSCISVEGYLELEKGLAEVEKEYLKVYEMVTECFGCECLILFFVRLKKLERNLSDMNFHLYFELKTMHF